MENHPLHYDIDAIGQDIVHFEDFIDSSFYLIQGADRALRWLRGEKKLSGEPTMSLMCD